MSEQPVPSGIIAELKRRRVFRVAAAYGIAAWIIIQVADSIFPALHLPDWTVTFVVVLALLGLPIALILAWAYELTPDGVRRTASAPAAAAAVTAPRRLNARAAGWIGVGIVAGLASFGAYGWVTTSRAAPDAPADRSIAVLPFANMSEVAENEYFSDGITEDILTQLALVRDLSVVSRTSVMKYKGTTLTIPEIGRELGVAYILEGSVRRSGNRVLITAQLIDAAADEHVWADSYEADLTDIFAVQAEVSAAIARELRASLTPGERGRIAAAPTDNVAAYDLVLRARELIGESATQNESAIEILKEAIRMDAGYADAYSALAGAYMQRVQLFGYPVEWADSGVALARRAIELDPLHARAHSALGTNLVQLGRDEEALAAYRRALELNPSSSSVLNNMASLESRRGRYDLAFPMLFRAQKLDPRSSYPALNLANGYAALGDTAAARHWLNRAGELGHPPSIVRALHALRDIQAGDRAGGTARLEGLLAEQPRDFIVRYAVLWAAVMTGRWERASEVSDGLYELVPESRPGDQASIRYLHGLTLWRTGERDAAAGVLARVVEEAGGGASGRAMPAYEAAGALAVQGRTEEALSWLERAYEAGYRDLPTLRLDPAFSAIRGHPRFEAVQARIRADLRAFAAIAARAAAGG